MIVAFLSIRLEPRIVVFLSVVVSCYYCGRPLAAARRTLGVCEVRGVCAGKSRCVVLYSVVR